MCARRRVAGPKKSRRSNSLHLFLELAIIADFLVLVFPHATLRLEIIDGGPASHCALHTYSFILWLGSHLLQHGINNEVVHYLVVTYPRPSRIAEAACPRVAKGSNGVLLSSWLPPSFSNFQSHLLHLALRFSLLLSRPSPCEKTRRLTLHNGSYLESDVLLRKWFDCTLRLLRNWWKCLT